MNINKIINREKFINLILKGGLLSSLFAILYPIVKYINPPIKEQPLPTNVSLGKVNELKLNSAKIFKYGREPGILIKTDTGELKALTATCTHLSCIVQYRKDFKHIWCACHNGHYDINGRNISGPPPRPLTQFNLKIKDDEIFVNLNS